MSKLAKYTKPYLFMLALAIILLFIQAYLDLALPDYLSRIVNTGIQQGGVENAVPAAIRKSEMNRVVIFLSAEDKDTILADYTLVDKNSADYDKYVAKYPILETESIYVLNEIDQTEIDRINPILGRAILTVSGIEQVLVLSRGAESDGFLEHLAFVLSESELPQARAGSRKSSPKRRVSRRAGPPSALPSSMPASDSRPRASLPSGESSTSPATAAPTTVRPPRSCATSWSRWASSSTACR